MMMKNSQSKENVDVLNELTSTYNTLMLSTMGEDDYPYASSSPYCMIGDKIYIYISKVADHYNNIIRNNHLSALIIADESKARNKFGIQRVTFKCNAKLLSEVDQEIWNRFDEIDKDTMSVLKTLDFDFFELSIVSGRLVEGFGQAYDIVYKDGKFQAQHVVIDKGHTKN